MKKFIALIFALFLFAGCVEESEQPLSVQGDDGSVYCAKKFMFEGHQYIMFQYRLNYCTGFVHDPNCECMVDYD